MKSIGRSMRNPQGEYSFLFLPTELDDPCQVPSDTKGRVDFGLLEGPNLADKVKVTFGLAR